MTYVVDAPLNPNNHHLGSFSLFTRLAKARAESQAVYFREHPNSVRQFYTVFPAYDEEYHRMF